MKKTVTIATTAGVVVLLIILALYIDLSIYSESPAGDNPAIMIFTIERGQDFGTTTRALNESGLINNPFKYRILARLKGYDKRVQAGEYVLSASLSPIEILDKLVSGKVRLHRVTIPEGHNLKQIAALVEEAGFVNRDIFYNAANNSELLRRLDIEAKTFEGYLFPDTYSFPRTASAEEIITAMVQRQRQVFLPEWHAQAEKIGLSTHQVLTLASIIEKETGAAHERPLISSVFHNRLKKGMRLETDPTVIYGLKDFNGNLTRKHLRTKTPYNTYKIKGLPPGPIASPGAEAIKAALFPAETNYLFFVSKKDTTHHFSANFKDHERAVRKYQLRRRRN